MRITIWDLDYYYSTKKINCFNPDAMKISSYHKQCGDEVTFVLKEYDINRPYDLYYIIKEKKETPMPPAKFLLDRKVRWWGKAVRLRVKWQMSDAMLGCRPDYLLYPEHNTKMERAEHIRLFNNKAELLPFVQNWTNTFKNKMVIVTDPYMWFSDNNSIIAALKKLKTVKKVSFLEPIWIQKLISYEEIKNLFLELNFTSGSQIKWTKINLQQADEVFKFIDEFKERFPHVNAGTILIDYRDKQKSHWESRDNALTDFNNIKKLIHICKNKGYSIELRMPQNRFETPYFALFEELSKWTHTHFKWSWLEYLTRAYRQNGAAIEDYWSNPKSWNDNYRDLLRQTWSDQDFLLHEWKDHYISINNIPWKIWEREFKDGI